MVLDGFGLAWDKKERRVDSLFKRLAAAGNANLASR
jgi:hypothetical protein